MKPWMVLLLLFSACTDAPQKETSEQKLEAQAKAIEQAADRMVNEAVADFEVVEISGDFVKQENTTTPGNQSN